MASNDALNALNNPASDSRTAQVLAQLPPNTAEAVAETARTILTEAIHE